MCTTKRRNLAIVASALVVASTLGAGASRQKFYSDDPIAMVMDSQDAAGVKDRDIDVIYDTLENSFSSPGDQTPNVRAQNVNTIDEVPDSSWFTNRLGARPVTVDELLRGPDTTNGPAPGPWTVISAKSDGVTPGFTIRDSALQVWFIKFDPPGYGAMATGTEVVVTKLFWALGYHVPEAHIATLRADDLVIGDRAEVRVPSGKRRALKQADIQTVLRQAHREADGSYRVIASKALDGRPVGGFRFYGLRPDDPNDLVPHEHRRELRAYGTFAAWLNHVDSKSINTLDTVIERDGRQFVRHHLLDFGSTIGSAGVYPREAYEGSEHLIEPKRALAGMPSLGLYVKGWRTIPIYRARSVGAFPINNSRWNPDAWKSRYPNPAFRSARFDDKFWAALRVQAFTDEMLNSVIRVGRFNDPHSEEMLSRFLIERRDAIVRRYLPAVNPIIDVRLNSKLTFRNAAVDAGVATAPPKYFVRWLQFDNVTLELTKLAETSSSEASFDVPVSLSAAPGTYIRVEIAAITSTTAWIMPVHAYFRRDDGNWTLVGFERLPEGNAPGTRDSERR